MTLSTRDKNLIWHPFTQEKTATEVIPVTRGDGSYLYDADGTAYLDLISSWWVNLHGHGHPDIAQSIYDQARTLDHVLFAGFTHEPAVQLCESLREVLPLSLKRFFFSDNGSTAIEVALKMAYQYWRNIGQPQKTIFLSFDGGYHGDTVGAMSIGATSGFHTHFSDLFFTVLPIAYPHTWDDDDTVALREEQALAQLDMYLTQYGASIAALIIEPLLQGASGMRLCRADFLCEIIDRVRAHHILVIFDEVMTGFYRTGTFFALEQVGRIPDFLCISKGITGGFLPLALTITHEDIYGSFLGDTFSSAFAHGHSYTANPLACRAAITSLRLLQEASCQQRIADIHAAHCRGIALLKGECSPVIRTRILGTVAAFDIPTLAHKLPDIKARFLQAGLLLRPLGTTVYLLPPYSILPAELNATYGTIVSILNET